MTKTFMVETLYNCNLLGYVKCSTSLLPFKVVAMSIYRPHHRFLAWYHLQLECYLHLCMCTRPCTSPLQPAHITLLTYCTLLLFNSCYLPDFLTHCNFHIIVMWHYLLPSPSEWTDSAFPHIYLPALYYFPLSIEYTILHSAVRTVRI